MQKANTGPSAKVSLLVKGGTIIDGKGLPRFVGDVRLRDGVIAEVGEHLAVADNESVYDAAGFIVAPGFVDIHTHLDAAMFW